MDRVVISGSGLLTGHGRQLDLHSGQRVLIEPFSLHAQLGDKALRRLDRVSEMAVSVVSDALIEAKLPLKFETEMATQTAAYFATGFGNLQGTFNFLERLQQKGARFCNPVDFPNLVLSAPVGALSIQFGIKGELLAFSQGTLSVLQALNTACAKITEHEAQVAIVCGADEHHQVVVDPAQNQQLLVAVGEGAGALVLVDESATDSRICVAASALSGCDGEAGLSEVLDQISLQSGFTKFDGVIAPKHHHEFVSHQVKTERMIDLRAIVGCFETVAAISLSFAFRCIKEDRSKVWVVIEEEAESGAAAVVLAGVQ